MGSTLLTLFVHGNMWGLIKRSFTWDDHWETKNDDISTTHGKQITQSFGAERNILINPYVTKCHNDGQRRNNKKHLTFVGSTQAPPLGHRWPFGKIDGCPWQMEQNPSKPVEPIYAQPGSSKGHLCPWDWVASVFEASWQRGRPIPPQLRRSRCAVRPEEPRLRLSGRLPPTTGGDPEYSS